MALKKLEPQYDCYIQICVTMKCVKGTTFYTVLFGFLKYAGTKFEIVIRCRVTLVF